MAMPLSLLFPQAGSSGDSDLLEQEHRKETLKELALESISMGNFREALTYLDSAIALAPYETELQELRQSVQDIVVLTEGTGSPGEGTVNDPDFTELSRPDDGSDRVISPDFAQELLTESQKEDPSVSRDRFILTLGGSSGLTQSVQITGDLIQSSDETSPVHPFSRFSGEARYFFEETDRQFGIAARYKGTLSNQDDIEMLIHQSDVTFHFRGFFAETMESRLILGAKAGIGYLFLNEIDEDGRETLTSHSTIITGLYFEDAVFRYLFKKRPFFNRIILDMNFDFYFLSTLDTISMAQFSIGGGYKFSPRLSLHVFNELFNSTNDIANANSWEGGVKFRYSY